MDDELYENNNNGALNRSNSISLSSSSMSRQASGDSSISNFSEILNAWEAELDAEEARRAADAAGASRSAGASTSNGDHSNSASGSGTVCAWGSSTTSGAGPSGSASTNHGINVGEGTAAHDNSSTVEAAGVRDPDLAPAQSAATPPRRPATSIPRSTTPATSASLPHRLSRPLTAGAGTARTTCAAAPALRRSVAPTSDSFSKTLAGSTSAGRKGGTSSVQPRRAAFIAGSVNAWPSTKPGKTGAAGHRDILLPRLPAPALDRIVPALPPATRAALRAASKGLRELVDAHTHTLTVRPDRRVAEDLTRRNIRAYDLFPALRHVTLILAGSCSGASGPATAGAAVAAQLPAAANSSHAGGGGSGGGRRSRASGSSASFTAAATAAAAPAAVAPSPPLPLCGWLAACGTARCLTSLTMHVGEVTPILEDIALSRTHPNLQHLELFVGRTGSPHGRPPVVQFMLGILTGLRHLNITWAGGPGAAAGGGGGGLLSAAPSLAHGSRRLFLDGRPRLGPLLLAGLPDLPRLESLELRGFLIDAEGHAMLAANWEALAGRLQRLVLSGLHLLVPADTPQVGGRVGAGAVRQDESGGGSRPERLERTGQHLGELAAGCGRLRELHADLCLPAPVGRPAGGAAAVAAALPGEAAAALVLGLMVAARDVRAVRPELLPRCLTRLSLPGVCLTRPEELEPLSRLRSLTNLEVTALGPGAGEYLTALRELRLVECRWRQLLDMLPWLPAAAAPQPPPIAAPAPPPPALAAVAQPPPAAAPAWRAGGPGWNRGAPPVGAWLEPARPQPPPQQPDQVVGPAGRGLGARVASAAAFGRGCGGAMEGSDPAVGAAAGLGDGGAAGAATAAAAAACGRLRGLEVVVCERLDDWLAGDRGLMARVGKALLPLVDGGVKVRLKVAEDALPHIWNESDEDGKPWEPAAVWQHVKAAQNLRRLQAETKAVAERLARGRQLQAARRKDRELHFVER